MSLIRSPEELEQTHGQIVRYSIAGNCPFIQATVGVAQAFRRAALAAYFATTGSRDSFLLSGHHADGRPDTGHRHAYYLPQPDRTGRIREMMVVSPFEPFQPADLLALQAVKAIQWNGPSARSRVELLDIDDRSAIKVACRWISLTPYVPIRRFWGTHGKHHLTPEKQLAAEIKRILPDCSVIFENFKKISTIRIRFATTSKTRLANAPIQHFGYSVELVSHEPLCFPLALGHSCHFGLGQFVPKE